MLDFSGSPAKSPKTVYIHKQVWNRVYEFSVESSVTGEARIPTKKFGLCIPLYNNLRDMGEGLVEALNAVAL